MQVALICAKCGKVHTETEDSCFLIVDFKQKIMSFICMNPKCKHDNIFKFDNWSDKCKSSPLPPTRIL